MSLYFLYFPLIKVRLMRMERFPPVHFSKKPKKDCILLYFCIIILFKGKAISYHLLSSHLGFAEEGRPCRKLAPQQQVRT
uniref:Uncharacterized protein n=1 Tax=Kuenenia stuttgartiensis TaxID=174633 RepID=Q1Q6J6_KUEST|nr:unknown protein [Candidatus Kuenenia stuttgartiensis]